MESTWGWTEEKVVHETNFLSKGSALRAGNEGKEMAGAGGPEPRVMGKRLGKPVAVVTVALENLTMAEEESRGAASTRLSGNQCQSHAAKDGLQQGLCAQLSDCAQQSGSAGQCSGWMRGQEDCFRQTVSSRSSRGRSCAWWAAAGRHCSVVLAGRQQLVEVVLCSS